MTPVSRKITSSPVDSPSGVRAHARLAAEAASIPRTALLCWPRVMLIVSQQLALTRAAPVGTRRWPAAASLDAASPRRQSPIPYATIVVLSSMHKGRKG